MDQELVRTFHQYLRRGGATKIYGNLFILLSFVVIGEVVPKMKHAASLAVLIPVIQDPFTILSLAVFLLSRTILNLMEFRLCEAAVSIPNRDPFFRELEITKRYRASFGENAFARGWKYRLIFVLLFGIATLRWALTWNRSQ